VINGTEISAYVLYSRQMGSSEKHVSSRIMDVLTPINPFCKKERASYNYGIAVVYDSFSVKEQQAQSMLY
jgi:hypothetical protein